MDVASVVAWLERNGTKKNRDAMARYAIPSDNAYGITVGALRLEARRLGQDHLLAAGLWKTGRYEARLLATFVDDPAEVGPAQMDRWCADFDSWAIVDTVCFHLFDKTPYAFAKVAEWSKKRGEMQRRAAFALLWALTVHDKQANDAAFMKGLALVEEAAYDDRPFVKKAVNMALRAVGKRNKALNVAAVEVAKRLAARADPTARWIGKDALRELTGPSVTRRLALRRRAAQSP